MKSRTTAQFRELFADLPEPIQAQTRKAYGDGIFCEGDRRIFPEPGS